MIFRHLLNMRSHPTWVRWIETWSLLGRMPIAASRTLRGCVD